MENTNEARFGSLNHRLTLWYVMENGNTGDGRSDIAPAIITIPA
jgi:hypothetical protein